MNEPNSKKSQKQLDWESLTYLQRNCKETTDFMSVVNQFLATQAEIEAPPTLSRWSLPQAEDTELAKN